MALPFAPVIRRVVEQQVDESVWQTHILPTFSGQAQDALLNWLADRLSDLVGPTLQRKFAVFRRDTTGQSGNGRYITFIEKHAHKALADSFAENTALAKCVNAVCTHWRSAVHELALRITGDWALLRSVLCIDAVAPVVEHVEFATGEHHDGGRVSATIDFGSGKVVIYKARPVDLDDVLARCLDLYNSHAEPADRLTPQHVIVRDGYGWAKVIEHRWATRDEQVESFFRRAGCLLAVCYALRATDMHAQNIIAHCDQPIIIDAETLLTPSARLLDPHAVSESFDCPLFWADHSVATIDLLPWPEKTVHKGLACGAGLIGGGAQTCRERQPVWHEPGTDDMGLSWEPVQFRARGNLPIRTEDLFVTRLHRAALEQGLSTAYQLIARHREAFLATAEGVPLFNELPVRLIPRHTTAYCSALERWTRSTERDVVAASLLDSWPHVQGAGAAYRHEVEALGGFDVPVFRTRVGSTQLLSDDATTTGFLVQTPRDAWRTRMALLTPHDLKQQLAILRSIT